MPSNLDAPPPELEDQRRGNPPMHSAIVAKGRRYGILGYLPEPSSKEAEIWDLNRAASPLLRLPPEIRNKIYRALLCGHRIHVVRDARTGAWGCVALRTAANPWTYRRRHVLGHSVTLLGPVCRQLYHETALLPYRENAWSWATPGLMERFLLTERRLPFLQRRAVREVCVKGIAGYGNLSRRLRGFLGGLEVVWFWEGTTGWVCEVVERERREGEGRPN